MRMPQVGDQFGRYRLDRVLGQGGMGIVFAATDPRLNRTVALKVITGVLADSPEFRDRFQAEAEALARLDSPHVIAIYDHDEIDGTPYIVTQFVDGTDLWSQLSEHGPMPARQALNLCAQLARGLADAHRVGVIHRDVKPGNVLLRNAGSADQHAYLCDFGIARADGINAPAPTAAGMIAGTWSYLAPERTSGAPATPASDIYALGCVLWMCLTGSEPYQGTDVTVAIAHQQAPIPRLPGDGAFTHQFNAVIERALAKDPAERYADASEFRADLERLATSAPADTVERAPVAGGAETVVRNSGPGLPVAPPPPPPPPGAQPGMPAAVTPHSAARRRRWPLVIAAVLALAIVAGLATWLLTRDSDSDNQADKKEPGIAGDLNDDGHGDARIQQSRFDALSPLPTWTLSSTGKLFTKAMETQSAVGTPSRGDVDGDGRPDTVWVEETSDEILSVHVEPGKGDAWDTEVRIEPDYDLQDYSARVGDVTGDGLGDLVLIGDAGDFDTVHVAVGKKNGFASPVGWYRADSPGGSLWIADVDGDETDDVIYWAEDETDDGVAGRIRVLLAGDNEFTASKDLDLTNAALDPFVSDWSVGDIDGNGDDELVIVGASHTGIVVHDIVDGSFVEQKLWWSITRTQQERRDEYDKDTSTDTTISDVDGDGDGDLVELLTTDAKAFTLSVFISDGKKFADAEDWGALECGAECSDSFDFID